jgi:sporadic carbohydrate cluster 2OG-Fe(II) oxygenase
MSFYNDGILIINNENIDFHKYLVKKISDAIGGYELQDFHKFTDRKTINDWRLRLYRDINLENEWDKNYYSMGKSIIDELIGVDILIQRKLNLSIQMPGDDTSVLGMHMDTLSGQSPFEFVMWTPLTNVFNTNGMYYFDKKISALIRDKMKIEPKLGLEYFRKKYWKDHKLIEINSSQVVIFSGTLFHGNIKNSTDITRFSINTRFKNLYSPETKSEIHERGVGIFYKLLKCSELTKLAMDYSNIEDKF